MEYTNRYIEQHKDEFLQQWFEILRIPSVSAQKEHSNDMERAADWLISTLREKLGMETQRIETKGAPLVYAESMKIPDAPTILIYGHYDVQPAEPLEEWISEPFEPEIRNGKVFCRGANDDKGQWCVHLCGAQVYLAENGKFPFQLKFIFEGEEEVGSDGLSNFLDNPENQKLLACDVLLVSDTSAAAPGIPAITYGLRGVMGFELKIIGPKRDLHSGIYGGSVYNPAIELSRLLSSLIDEKGVIKIPGFYDDVIEIDALERDALAANPFDPEENKLQIGIEEEFGEPGYTTLERRGARPSFDINGLTSGYQGEGGKTIIPSWASAKFTFRTVPNQDPEKICRSLDMMLHSLVPSGVKMQLTHQHMSKGMVIPLTGRFIKAASDALELAFGNKVRYLRDGGSIPIVAKLRNVLNAETILAGFGLDDDGIHSPNEKFDLDSFFRGIRASVAILKAFNKIK